MKNQNPLMDYLNSLEKIEKLDVETVLPAHEEIFSHHQERIKEIRDHHEKRLMEIIDGLKTGSSTAYMLASKVHWNVKSKSWDGFSLFHKFFALGEVAAHLIFLTQKQRVKRTEEDEVIFYHINKNDEIKE